MRRWLQASLLPLKLIVLCSVLHKYFSRYRAYLGEFSIVTEKSESVPIEYDAIQKQWGVTNRKLLRESKKESFFHRSMNSVDFDGSDSSNLTIFTPESTQPLKNRVFYVMGDMPYDSEEAELLVKQIKDLDPEHDEAEFIVHLGDIMRADTCNSSEYSKVKNILLKSPLPVFIIPGDNDWNDCPNPKKAWKKWKNKFIGFDKRWNSELKVRRQRSRTENFVFLYRGVLFIGVHIIGGDYHEEEWRRRHRQSFIWTRNSLKRHSGEMDAVVLLGHARRNWKHEDYFDPLLVLIDENYGDIPFMYCHGDGHVYNVREKYMNFLDVEVNSGKKAPPIKVTISYEHVERAKMKFSIDQRGGKY